MKLDKQQLIIIGLAAALLCGFGIFQYLPIIRHQSEIQEQIAQQDQLSETVCASGALLPELKYQERQLQEELIPFSKKIPKGRNFATLWQKIADVMNECKLSHQLVQPGEEQKSDQLCSIPLTLECQGTIGQLFEFLKAMENMERLIRFEQVKFENDGDFSGVVKFYAKALIYYQPDDRGNI